MSRTTARRTIIDDPTPPSRPMSARQYRQMQEIRANYISSQTVGAYDQRPLTGLLKRQWVEFGRGKWAWTQAGAEAMRLYENVEIKRKAPSDVLGVYVQAYLDVSRTTANTKSSRKVA